MKLKSFFIFLFLLQGLPACSQIFPFIGDLPSLGASIKSRKRYVFNLNEDRTLKRDVNKFYNQYKKRRTYLNRASARIIAVKINTEINAARDRHTDLKKKNKSLLFFAYSRKKVNTEILSTIDKMVNNMRKELSKQNYSNILLGEKLNLYQNTMESLSKIHRLMDIVEDNISKSALLSRLTQKKNKK